MLCSKLVCPYLVLKKYVENIADKARLQQHVAVYLHWTCLQNNLNSV